MKLGREADMLEAQLYLRNNAIRSRRKTLGYTQAWLAQLVGVSVLTLQAWENCRRLPTRPGDLAGLATALGCEASDLFPAAVRPFYQQKPRIVQLSKNELKQLSRNMERIPLLEQPGVAEEVEDTERAIMVHKILDTLPAVEREIVKKRYGFDTKAQTLEEIGLEYGVTRERIRQIESKALRHLRHPGKNKYLRQVLYGSE